MTQQLTPQQKYYEKKKHILNSEKKDNRRDEFTRILEFKYKKKPSQMTIIVDYKRKSTDQECFICHRKATTSSILDGHYICRWCNRSFTEFYIKPKTD